MVTIKSLPVNGGGYITGIMISPSSPNIVYASSDLGGMYRSSNYGANWSIIVKGLDSNADLSVTTIAIDPKNPDIVYIGTGHIWGNPTGNYGGIFKTTNGGQTWELMTRDVTFAAVGTFDVQGRLIVVDPMNSNIVYAGSHRDGIFKSTNAGRTWSYKGLDNKYLSTVVIDPTNSNILYATSQNAVAPTPGIYKSTDGGSTWSTLTTSYNVYDLTIDAKNPQNLYIAAFDQGVFKSTNGGSSWSRIFIQSGIQFVSISASVTNPQIIYLKSRSTNKVWISKNGGASWNPNGSLHSDGWYYGTTKFGWSSSPITADPTNENRAYLGSWFAVWRTDNAGSDWTVRPNGLETSCAFDCTVNPRIPNEIWECHADIGLFKSTNRGTTWTRMNPVGGNCWAIAIDKSTNPSTVYAGTGNWSGNTTNGKIFKSTNGGASWTAVTSGLSDSRVRTIVVDPANPDIVYAGQTNGRIYKSLNKGGSWVSKSHGLGTSEVYRIAINPNNRNIIYAVQRSSGVSRSTDGGNNWSQINEGITRIEAHDIAIDPNNPNIIYTATKNDGIYRSTNGGTSWTRVLDSFGGRSVSVDPNSVVYAGGLKQWSSSTTSGLYRSTDGINWTRIDDGYLSQGIENIEIDPTDTSKVYISTVGNGTYLVTVSGSSPPPQTPTPVPTYTPVPTETPTPVPGEYEYIVKQSEAYIQINPPMIKVLHITSNGRYYVHCPTGHETGGFVKYAFNVSKPGQFKIAALVEADSVYHNSFAVVVDSQSRIIWDIKPESSWQWVHVSSRGSGSELHPQHPVYMFNLNAGAHTIMIYDRNEQTKLKKFILTNNMDYIPGHAIPREFPVNIDSNPQGAQIYIWKV